MELNYGCYLTLSKNCGKGLEMKKPAPFKNDAGIPV